jgi:hypothetical protein
MITRSQTRRLTSSPNPSETSLASFASDQDSGNNLSSSNLSLIFDETPPNFDNSDPSLFNQTYSIHENQIMSTLNANLALKLIPNFDGRRFQIHHGQTMDPYVAT